MRNIVSDIYQSVCAKSANFSLFGDLTERHQQDLELIRQLFLIHIKGAACPTQLESREDQKPFMYIFSRTETTALVQPNFQWNQVDHWVTQMVDGRLRCFAREIVSNICAYQVQKEIQYNSAECMFLEEIKDWATHTLAALKTNKDTLVLVNRRVRYFETILAQHNLFYSELGSDLTVQHLILAICSCLKDNVVPVIQNEISQTFSLDLLKSFKSILIEVLQEGAYVLYHVFRDSKTVTISPPTLTTFFNNTELMDTTSGKLLLHLCSSGAYLEAFPDSKASIRACLHGTTLPQNQMSVATLYDSNGNLCMPSDLWHAITKEVLPGPVLLTEDRLKRIFSRKSNTGLEKGFCGHPYIAENFVRAHATLNEIAKFFQVLERAITCAGLGGDLLLYGFANKQLNSILETYKILAKIVHSQFELLVKISEIRFQQLVATNKAEPTRNTFIPHYRHIHSRFWFFCDLLQKTEEQCEEILRLANSFSFSQNFQALKLHTKEFIHIADSFSKHLAGTLKIPYNPVTAQPVVWELSFPSARSLLDAGRKNSNLNADELFDSTLQALERERTSGPHLYTDSLEVLPFNCESKMQSMSTTSLNDDKALTAVSQVKDHSLEVPKRSPKLVTFVWKPSVNEQENIARFVTKLGRLKQGDKFEIELNHISSASVLKVFEILNTLNGVPFISSLTIVDSNLFNVDLRLSNLLVESQIGILVLKNCKMSCKDMNPIARGIRENTTLTHLSLVDNDEIPEIWLNLQSILKLRRNELALRKLELYRTTDPTNVDSVLFELEDIAITSKMHPDLIIHFHLPGVTIVAPSSDKGKKIKAEMFNFYDQQCTVKKRHHDLLRLSLEY